MEFMPQPHEVMNSPAAVVPSNDAAIAHVVEEEVAAAIKIGSDQNNQNNVQQQQQQQQFQQQQQQEQPIYYSDGPMYPSELTQQTDLQSDTDQTVAIPDNLIEIYNNLGILGKLLTGGSIVTIRFLQAFRAIGENLVDVLGITKPKYEYELNLAKQMQQQEEDRKKKLDQLYSPWQSPPNVPPIVSPATAPANTVLNMDTNVVNIESTISPPPMTVPVQYHQMPQSPNIVPQMPPAPPTQLSTLPILQSNSSIPPQTESLPQPAIIPQTELPLQTVLLPQ